MNNNESKVSSLPVGKRGRPFIMTYRHHLMIKQIEFFKRELNDLLNYGTLDETAAGSAKDIQDMIEQHIAAFVNEVHERSIWTQAKKGKNGSTTIMWLTRLGNRQVSSTTEEGLYEKIYYYYKTGNPYLANRNQGAVKTYRWLYILAVFIGPYMTVEAVWNIADIFNALMAIPNLIAIIALRNVIADETKLFFAKYHMK